MFSSRSEMWMCYLGLLSVCSVEVAGRGINYPSIVWDPRNPLFSCEEPTIKIQYNDEVSFLCPNKKIHPYILPENAEAEFFESLYYVKEQAAFDACNATDGRLLLSCTDDQKDESHHMPFAITSSDSLNFVKGTYMHFIGTSFRTAANSRNTIGGSCNTISQSNEFKLRLKLYLCTDEEVDRGECKLCKTDSCYYSGCSNNCTSWTSTTKLLFTADGNCKVEQQRDCINSLSNKQRVETRLVENECPRKNCTLWLNNNEEKFQVAPGECRVRQTRMCTTSEGVGHIESRLTSTECPAEICSEWKVKEKIVYSGASCVAIKTQTCYHPWTKSSVIYHGEVNISCPIASPNTPAQSTGNVASEKTVNAKVLYATIGGALLCAIISFALGAAWFKCNNRKTCAENKQQQDAASDGGYDNRAYSPTQDTYSIHREPPVTYAPETKSPMVHIKGYIVSSGSLSGLPKRVSRQASDLNGLIAQKEVGFRDRLRSEECPVPSEQTIHVIADEL